MPEYLHPTIAVTEQALQSMREQDITHIMLNRNDFDSVAELVGREPFEAGALHLAYGGTRRRFAGMKLGAIQYDFDAEYDVVLQANGNSVDVRRNDLPRHDPSPAMEAGLFSTWPIPDEWTEQGLSRAAAHALRFPPPLLRNIVLVNTIFISAGAAGGAVYAHEQGLSVLELSLLGGVSGMAAGALATAAGLSIASQRNWNHIRTEAEKLRPFRIVRKNV